MKTEKLKEILAGYSHRGVSGDFLDLLIQAGIDDLTAQKPPKIHRKIESHNNMLDREFIYEAIADRAIKIAKTIETEGAYVEDVNVDGIYGQMTISMDGCHFRPGYQDA